MSIQALAKDLGLSISTVSRALNGYTDVSPATRERVAQRAQELNYKPHPGARSLKSGKTHAIGIVLPMDKNGGRFIDDMYSSLLGGMAHVMEKAGYHLVATTHVNRSPQDELDRYENFIRGNWFDAFVVVRTRLQDPRVRLLLEHRIPFVTYGRSQVEPDHPWVDPDNEQAFFMATQRQIGFGHRRIALLNGPAIYTFALLRQTGYESALAAAGLPLEANLLLHGELTESSGYAMAQQLLKLPQPPTALLCATDAMAIGAMAACRNAGLEVGRDMSIMGYGNNDAGRFCSPPLTTIEHSVTENGRHVAQLLLQSLGGKPLHNAHHLEPVLLVPRASDGPPRAT